VSHDGTDSEENATGLHHSCWPHLRFDSDILIWKHKSLKSPFELAIDSYAWTRFGKSGPTATGKAAPVSIQLSILDFQFSCDAPWHFALFSLSECISITKHTGIISAVSL
jgi:hypothetical protein